MKIYLTAILKAKPGKVSILKSILQQMVIASRKEEDCLQYDLFQSNEDENVFIFNEIWANQKGLDHHNDQPHLVNFQKASDSILNEPVIIYKSQKIS